MHSNFDSADMAHHGGSAQTRSNHLIRKHKAGRRKGRGPATERAASFPVFGERQRREFDSSPYPMRIIDHGTLRYLAVNDAAVNLYGYCREEFLGLTLFQTRHPDEHDSLVESFAEPTGCLCFGEPGRQIKKSGEIILEEVLSQDILFDRRRARLSVILDESESKYRNLVESSTDVIWSTDAAGRITFINEAVRGIYGYEPLEMLGRSVIELLGDQRRKKPFGFFRTMLAQDRSVADYECDLSAKNGQRVILSSNAVVVRDAEGNRIGVTGVSKDITVRKRMEGELRRSEERFRQLAENIRQVFWIKTLAGNKIDYVSPGYEEIWGRSRESLYRDPRSRMESIHPEDLPAVQRGQEQMARGEHTEVDYRIIRPDGTTRWINDRSYPMKRSDGTQLVCGIAEDITDRKRAEQDRLTHAILQRDALVREVHHRIKNSLQGIVGMLRRRISKYPAVAHEIEDTIAQLRSVALVYGLQGTRSDGLLPLAEVTDTICSSVESLIGGRVDRTFEQSSQRPACVAGSEAVSVAVALNELIVNALKHQPAEAGEKHARVSVREGADAAEIRIFNRGSLPASFDFGSGRAVGNGLGLVRTLLASPGGNIAFNGGRDGVEVVLTLTRPLLAEREIALGE